MKKGLLDGYKRYDTSGGFGNAKEWKKLFQQRMSKDEARDLIGDEIATARELLGVDAKADEQTIKKAYRKKVMQWHPDKNPDKLEEAAAMTRKIIAAYTLLT